MKWKKACTNHPENQSKKHWKYHILHGYICKDCGRKITTTEGVSN